MGILRTFASLLLSLIFVIILSAAMLGTSVQTLLYPDTYEKALEKGNLYVLIEKQAKAAPGAEFIKGGTNATLKKVLRNSLAYLRGDAEDVNLTVEIDKGAMRTFFLSQAESFPVCNENVTLVSLDNLTCRPPNMEPGKLVDMVLEQRNVTFPDSVDLMDVFDKERNISKAREYVGTFRMAILGVHLIALLLLLVIAFIHRKDAISAARWAGANLLLAGSIAIVIAAIAGNYIQQFMSQVQLSQLPAAAVFLDSIVSAVLGAEMLYGVVVFSAGVALVVFSVSRRNKDEEKRSK